MDGYTGVDFSYDVGNEQHWYTYLAVSTMMGFTWRIVRWKVCYKSAVSRGNLVSPSSFYREKVRIDEVPIA